MVWDVLFVRSTTISSYNLAFTFHPFHSSFLQYSMSCAQFMVSFRLLIGLVKGLFLATTPRIAIGERNRAFLLLFI